MKELVVISGKGGTGKTSLAASLAALASSAVLVDCDVDAADLHLVLEPQIEQEVDFSGGNTAVLDAEKCTGCGRCRDVCRFDAIRKAKKEEPRPGAGVEDENKSPRHYVRSFEVIGYKCEGCGVCARVCPEKAIRMVPAVNGQWFKSQTRHGPMVHARLGVAEENSGKLVSLIRKEAQILADELKKEWIIIDGSPGIGCPVIASITGADLVVVVTEPTQSGMHDLERVAELTSHFGIETLICINKWDINPDMTLDIEDWALEKGLAVAGRLGYDRAVTKAQMEKLSVVEYDKNCRISREIMDVWKEIEDRMIDMG